MKIEMNGVLDIDRVMTLLKGTYWAKDRPRDVMEKALASSDHIGVYHEDLLVGFARIVTDHATMFWLCDVVVDESYRGRGIGKLMMEHLSKQAYYDSLKGILATNDAHGLYEQYGFVREPYKMMSKSRKG